MKRFKVYKVKFLFTLISGLTDQQYNVILFTVCTKLYNFARNIIAVYVECNIIWYFLDNFHTADMKSL